MDEVIHGTAIGGFLVSIIVLVVGLIRPRTFRRFLGSKATRKHIALYAIALFFVTVSLGTVFEPDSVKQARLAKANQAKIAEQLRVDSEKKKQEELAYQQDQSREAERIAQEKEGAAKPEKEARRYYWHHVTGVVDGNTVQASVDGKVETIQIIGIDVPAATECFGTQATNKSKEFVSGKWIQLEGDQSQGDRDKSKALLRYVWFDDGTDLGNRLIEEGYGYEQAGKVLYQKQSQYKSTQTYAKGKSHGLWSADTCKGSKKMPAPQVKSVKKSAPALKPKSVPAPSPKPTPNPKPAPAPRPSSNCHPNYTGKCVPKASDVDCAGGSGNGPAYVSGPVTVVGYDVYGLDGDDDGIGCE